jgi:hypothetical protein
MLLQPVDMSVSLEDLTPVSQIKEREHLFSRFQLIMSAPEVPLWVGFRVQYLFHQIWMTARCPLGTVLTAKRDGPLAAPQFS